MTNTVIYVETQSQLVSVVSQFAKASLLAVDSEFMRRNTYMPIGGLLQIYDGELCAIIDLVALEQNIQDIAPVFANPAITKVFHSATEDIELLYQLLPVDSFKSICDTQILYAIQKGVLGIGFKNMVQQLLGVELDKSETQSDWLARPLSKQQLIYACDDVVYLLDSFNCLKAGIQSELAESIFFDECEERFSPRSRYEPAPEKAYKKFGQLNNLNSSARRALYFLAKWREQTAIATNQPKGFVVKDDALLTIAQRQPKSMEQLTLLDCLRHSDRRRYGEQIIAQCLEAAQSDIAIPRPKLAKDIAGYKELRVAIKDELSLIAEELAIPDNFLASNKQIDRFILKCHKNLATASLLGWRGRLLDSRLKAAIQ